MKWNKDLLLDPGWIKARELLLFSWPELNSRRYAKDLLANIVVRFNWRPPWSLSPDRRPGK